MNNNITSEHQRMKNQFRHATCGNQLESMNTLYICYRHICLKVVCKPVVEAELREHFCSDLIYTAPEPVTPSFTLFIGVPGSGEDCVFSRLLNKVFHGATMSCWISNTQRNCWIDDFTAPTLRDIMLCIRYFCSNVFNRLLELNGYIGIHSSCVSYKGKGVVFIGDRMAGKTTSMLTLIDAGFGLVCNDESAMKYNPIEDRIDVFGIHNDIYIRMREHLCRQTYGRKYVSLAEQQGIGIDTGVGLDENRIIISHKHLAELNNVPLFPATHADLVIFPKYCPEANRTHFSIVEEEKSVQYLLGQETELIHETTVFLYEMRLPNGTRVELPTFAHSLARKTCYCCEYNENTANDFVERVKNLCENLLL